MKEILAMPSLCDSTTFGLDVEDYNRKQGLSWLKRKPQLVEELPHTKLYRVGDPHNGFFFLWDAEEQLVGYYMRYKVKTTKLHGVSVTQTALWRSLTAKDTKGLTHHIVFDLLLKEYVALLSDQIQTERGRDFWIDLMTQAIGKYDVSLVDFNAQLVHTILLGAELRLWLSDPDDNPWSWYSMKHRGLRFMIARKGAIK